jgi:PAS domain S-box-containing protein
MSEAPLLSVEGLVRSPRTAWLVLAVGVGVSSVPWGNAFLHGSPENFAAVLTLILGAGASLLVFSYLRILLAAQERAVALAGEMIANLRENEDRFRLITENMADLIVVADAAGRRLYTSPSHQRLLGHEVGALERAPLTAHVHPDDRPRLTEANELALTSGEASVVELRLGCRDGSWRTLESRISSITDGLGQVRLLMVGRDITERQQAWEAVKVSQSFLQSLVESLPQRVLRKDREGRFTFVNALFAQSLHRPAHEILGHTDRDFFPPELAEKYQADDRQVMAERKTVDFVETYQGADGNPRWIQVIKTPLFDLNDEVSGVQIMFWDVSERELAQGELRRSHEEIELLLASISTVLIGVDRQGRVSRWNRAAEAAFGIPGIQALGHPLMDCRIPWDWSRVRQGIMDCSVGRRTVELDNVSCLGAGGKDAFYHLIFNASNGDGTSQLDFIVLGQDVTGGRLLEAQLRQAQKLESIGQLAAGIAHEINTPTQFIGDNLHFLRDAFTDLTPVLRCATFFSSQPPGTEPPASMLEALRESLAKADVEYLLAEMPKAIGQSEEGIDRVARIVKAMKEFSHPDVDEMSPADLNRAIESTIAVARNEWKYVADMVTDYDTRLPLVPCFPGDFNQVILNLIVNAAHALADSPAVKRGGKGLITLQTRLLPAEVEIRVQDTGGGIPESIRSKIFNPFFTTKEVGKGTGQGLFLAHNVVVEKHGGSISFESEVGVGTVFIIRLPLKAKKRAGKVT